MKTILITAGGTSEPIDNIRSITNTGTGGNTGGSTGGDGGGDNGGDNGEGLDMG